MKGYMFFALLFAAGFLGGFGATWLALEALSVCLMR